MQTAGYNAMIAVGGGLLGVVAALYGSHLANMSSGASPATGNTEPLHGNGDGWRAYVDNQIRQVIDRQQQENPRTACNIFVGEAMQSIFNLHDFDDPKVSGEFMSADEIADKVAISSEWQPVGNADDQDALRIAQQLANDGQPVIAVGHGHVVLIKPGDLQESGSWEMQVPNSAGMSLDDPKRTYSDGRLSRSWRSEDTPEVQIYVRDS